MSTLVTSLLFCLSWFVFLIILYFGFELIKQLPSSTDTTNSSPTSDSTTSKSQTTSKASSTSKKPTTTTKDTGNTGGGTTGGGEWRDGKSSMYNISDPVQNHGYVGMIYCDEHKGILGKAQGQYNDNDNLVALSSKHMDSNRNLYCGAKIEIRNPANGKTTTTYILDRMAATEADLDLLPAVVRALGLRDRTWLDPIQWRLL